MAFRIGRNRAQHTYPQSRASGSLPFARNSAFGPATDTTILPGDPAAPGAAIIFSTFESGGAGTGVPITPRVTGIVLVTATIECVTLTEDPDQLTVQISVGAAPPTLVPLSGNSAPASVGEGSITSASFTMVLGLSVGITHHVSMWTSSNNSDMLSLQAHCSWLSLEEVQTATG